jgi:uncharacterized phiE125 gp8 family phage protein
LIKPNSPQKGGFLLSTKIYSAPATEPLSLAEVKEHLRLDSGSVADNVTTAQSIAPGDHVIAASYSLKGAGVNVLGYRTLVNLNCGENGDGGTVDAKIQESDTDSDAAYADWTGGAFTQVTTSYDNAVQEKEYTGTKAYIRVVATVAVATCDFGADIVKIQPYSAEDILLTNLIKAAREYCENFQGRSYITQTWDLLLDDWPDEDYIKVPYPPLVSVSSVKYYDTDSTEATMDSGDYYVDTYAEPGRIVLGYGESWPSTTLRPANGVIVRFVAGYGAAASVPQCVKQAMLMLIGHWYENRESTLTGQINDEIKFAVHALLWMDRICAF